MNLNLKKINLWKSCCTSLNNTLILYPCLYPSSNLCNHSCESEDRSASVEYELHNRQDWKSHSASGKIKESEPDSMYFPVVKMSGMH